MAQRSDQKYAEITCRDDSPEMHLEYLQKYDTENEKI